MASHSIVHPERRPARLEKRAADAGVSLVRPSGSREGRRLAVFALIVAALAGASLLGLAGSGHLRMAATAAYEATERGWAADSRFSAGRTVVVRAGDTLWTLAMRYGPEGADVRAVVDWIRRENGLEGAVLVPGQAVVVPAGTGR